MTLPETASFKEFAGIARFKPSYITQLKAEGRLVLTEDGKRVRVAESLQRIADTKDPAKIGVAARHAAQRKAEEASAMLDIPGNASDIESENPNEDVAGTQAVRKSIFEEQLRKLRRENDVAGGRLISAEDVAQAAASHVTLLRTRLEAIPDVLAPQLAAARDEAHVRALLAESIEHMLGEASRQFFELVKMAA